MEEIKGMWIPQEIINLINLKSITWTEAVLLSEVWVLSNNRTCTASVYITPTSKFYTTPQFNECYDKLLEIEMRFSKYAKEQWLWMFDHEQKYNMLKGEFPLRVTAEDALRLMSQELV